jgi:hypothetical protein
MNRILFVVACVLIISDTALAQSPSSDLLSASQYRSDFRSRRISSYDSSGNNVDRIENIKSGERRTIASIRGAGIINHIWITIAPGPDIIKRDDLVLRMYWDNNSFPSVEAPLGSFFGQGWNEAYPLNSQPLVVAPGGSKALVSYFTMPFAAGARIEIENQGEKAVEAFYFYVDYYEVSKLPENFGRFHAWYNQELTESGEEGENEWAVLGQQKNNTRPDKNYLILDTKGKGQFIGVNYYVHSPTPMWYGEGDDMIYIDGSAAPVLHGTGTEDYFNTSWSPKESFQTPYFGAPRVNTTDPAYISNGWLGRTHVYRFHVSDPIYFSNSFRFTIEHGHNNVLALDVRTVAYWYQTQATQVPAIKTQKERAPMPMITPVDIHKWRDSWRREKKSEKKLWGNE